VFNRDFQVVKSGRPTQPVIGVTRRSAPDFRVRLSVNQNTYASAMTVITTKAISSSIVAAMNSTHKKRDRHPILRRSLVRNSQTI
jgi:hypothetical protein